jgi:dihydrofolate reductase
LKSVDDETTRVVNTDLHDEILKMKAEPGKSILVGGVDIPSQLIELGLVDEFRFVVGPIVVGEGRRLFDGATPPENLRLKFVDSHVFGSGRIALRYIKD